MAALYLVDVDAAGLRNYGRPDNYFERKVSLWTKQYRASKTETIIEMERLMEWLRTHMPKMTGRCLWSMGIFLTNACSTQPLYEG